VSIVLHLLHVHPELAEHLLDVPRVLRQALGVDRNIQKKQLEDRLRVVEEENRALREQGESGIARRSWAWLGGS
jgi:hypothetical protein